uniref:Uncharacterized protein n=1 Tax=Tanacetum cinerariifolium TaxID=118510 RepID=A0A6L2P0A2_TANCI|nr:hypothetical protein [Tanacetum cinerariifolium]
MSTQQDICAAGSESRPPMLNKENYVLWSSHLLRYAKSRPNEKLIHNSILNGPYVRKMIPEPADDQPIQTILLGLPEDIYAAVDSCETAQEIWLRVQQMMKGSDIGIQEKKAKLFNEWESQNRVDMLLLFIRPKTCTQTQDPLALMANSNNPYAFPAPHQDQSSFNQNYLQQLIPNPEDTTDPTTAMNMTLALMAKAFQLNYSSPTNNNQMISSNPRNRQIAQPGMNIGQDRQMQMVGGNGGNHFRQYAGQNARNPARYNDVIGNQVIQNVVQNPRVQNAGNQNGFIGVQGNGNQNQIGNGNLVAARAEGNVAGQNGNQIRRKKAGIQLQAEEYDLMAAAADLDEIEEVNANCILMANLQQASTLARLVLPHRTKMALGYQNPFYLKQAQKKQQSLYDGKVLHKKHDPPVVHDSEETLQFAQESRDKMKQINKEIKPANYTKINHLSGVFVPQTALSREELYFLNNFKTANVSKSISIPNEDLSDNTTPNVARKFPNEVKSTIVTLQCVVKQRMTIETHNWASSAHQELHKIVREEIFSIVNSLVICQFWSL